MGVGRRLGNKQSSTVEPHQGAVICTVDTVTCAEHVSGVHVASWDVYAVRTGAMVLLMASASPVPGT